MPHVPEAPAGSRFFARIDRFHCECPACGALIVAHKDPSVRTSSPAMTKRRRTLYNPIMSIVTCPSCRRAFGVGLMLWSLGRGGPGRRVPADHQPTRRQLRELASYSYGVWAAEIKRQGDELNIAIDQECCCPRSEGGWAPRCPVHGWEQVKRQQAEIDPEREG